MEGFEQKQDPRGPPSEAQQPIGIPPEQVIITKVKNGIIVQTANGIYVSSKLSEAYLIVQHALDLK